MENKMKIIALALVTLLLSLSSALADDLSYVDIQCRIGSKHYLITVIMPTELPMSEKEKLAEFMCDSIWEK